MVDSEFPEPQQLIGLWTAERSPSEFVPYGLMRFWIREGGVGTIFEKYDQHRGIVEADVSNFRNSNGWVSFEKKYVTTGINDLPIKYETTSRDLKGLLYGTWHFGAGKGSEKGPFYLVQFPDNSGEAEAELGMVLLALEDNLLKRIATSRNEFTFPPIVRTVGGYVLA